MVHLIMQEILVWLQMKKYYRLYLRFILLDNILKKVRTLDKEIIK